MRSTTSSFLLAASLCALILTVIGITAAVFPVQLQQDAKGKDVMERTLLDADIRQEKEKGLGIAKSMLSLFSFMPGVEKTQKSFLIASMIENHEDARAYQQGLMEAEIVFEMIVEGDISRFLALYRSDKLPEKIGPVRSLRPHFISVLRGFHPLLLHIGGSQLAYDMVRQTKQIINHDGIRYDGQTFQRDPNGVAPHNLFMAREALEGVIEEYTEQLTEESFPLYPIIRNKPEGEKAETVELSFGSPTHDVTLTYSSRKNTYTRSIFNADVQATPSNILVLEADVQGYHQRGAVPWTKTFGNGKAFLFRNGVKTDALWERGQTDTFSFTDTEGNPLQFAPGQIWITLLPDITEQVSWETKETEEAKE